MSAALATLGVGLGSGFLNTAGSVYTNAMNTAAQLAINKQNAAVQYAINADQIEAARMNNETAINLANTAHQREVRDLRDANLNPILSANGNGSSVPSLDTPGLEAPQAAAPTVENPLSGLASSLASAVQVNDAHELNKARVASLGLGGNPEYGGISPAGIAKLYSQKTAADLQSAREAAELAHDKAIFERERLATERYVYGKLFGHGAIDTDSDGFKLAVEGLLSDLKMRANRNFREGLNSATNVGNAVRGFLPKHWFK